MAKFSISGRDEETGQFYYQRSWFSPRCLCGFDPKDLANHLSWYDRTIMRISNRLDKALSASYIRSLKEKASRFRKAPHVTKNNA